MTDSAPLPAFDDALAQMLQLYEQGDCVAAWELGQQYGPMEQWPGMAARMLAGRLAMHLGAPRLGALIHLKAFRADRDHPDAQYYSVFRILGRRGALAAWEERKKLGKPRNADAEAVADYHGQCAQILGGLRDFEAAEHHVGQASLPDGARPYWYVERSGLYELEDRYDDALEAARTGMQRQPRYPPTIASTAHCLQLLGRDEEALRLLRSSSQDAESSYVTAYLIRVLLKRRLLDELPDAIARFEALTPLREKDARTWLSSVRAELAIHRGEYGEAMELVKDIDHPYYGRIAENLRAFLSDPARPDPKRVELDVPFVRQHHLTCAPATLTAISHFWSRPAEHLSVAEEICYDGTPDYSERRWANTNGWVTREFRVDWDIATALIDRDIPFTLTVSDIAAGHLQAVIGYDTPTGVLLARDPFVHDTIEINARDMVLAQAASGPRGMAMVPSDDAARLDTLHFPDGELYDLYHEVQLALQRHDREDALRWHHRMIAVGPAHRLTHHARRSLAGYDENAHEALAAIDALLALYPDDQRLHLDRLANMRQLASRDERLAWLESVTARPGTNPLLWIELASELAIDDRRIPDALNHVRRALRRRPDDARGIHQLAQLSWQLGQLATATELYRFAACLAPGRDDIAMVYFQACRGIKETATGLEFLEARVERAGGLAAGPGIAVFNALESLDRTDDAFVVLAAAVDRRPEDGALRLFAANRFSRYGRTDAARQHLEAARHGVKHSDWLAEAARMARSEGDREAALGNWREVLAAEPLNTGAHGMVALLLSETGTADDALAHLRSACGTFPSHAGLHRLLYQWSANETAAVQESVLRKLLAIDPADAWAMRELALNLNQQTQTVEALAAADEAISLDAANPSGYGVKGHLLATAGRSAEAAECFRAAITRSADAVAAIHGFLETCGTTVADRTAALAFVEEQIQVQALAGDGVLAYRAAARGLLTADELLASLQRMHAARPDLWHAWSALTHHLADMGRLDEALVVARGATERYSRIASLWFDLGIVHRARLETADEIAALQRCHELSPETSETVLALAGALERRGDLADAQEALEAAIARTPLASELRVELAEMLQRRGKTEQAIGAVREALRRDPESEPAWRALTSLLDGSGHGEEAIDFARTIAESRPREARAWLRLAHLELGASRAEAALTTVERAIAASARSESAHDLRAVILANLRRFREAIEACDPPALRERPSYLLQGRAAWVEAERGDVAAAIARMEPVVTRTPDYAWGWSQLIAWYSGREELEKAAAAATRLAWLDPASVVAFNWLGDLKERMGDTAGAKEAYGHAMSRSPSDLFAGLRYFALQKDERDLAGAEQTLGILATHVAPEQLLHARVELEIARPNLKSALALIQDACRDTMIERAALVGAIDAIPANHWSVPLQAALGDVLREPTWNAATPELWAIVRVRQGRLPSLRQYRWLAAAGDPATPAVRQLLSAIGTRAQRTAPFPLHPTGWWLDLHLVLIRRLFPACRDDDLVWGQMGFALACRGRHGSVIRWLRDWPHRAGVRSWMLQNLSLAYLATGRDSDALGVLRRVATQHAASEDIGITLRHWAALGACLDGEIMVAERLLDEMPVDAVPAGERPLHAFTEAAVAILRRRAGPRTMTQSEREVLGGPARHGQVDPATAHLVALVRSNIGNHVGDRGMRFSAWRELHPMLWPALLIGGLVTLLRLVTTLIG